MGFDLGDLKRMGKKVMKQTPLIGTLLGGPTGSVVANMVATALGVEGDNLSAIEKKLEGDPQALLDLKKFEMSNQAELQRLAIQEASAYLADTQSARQREIAVTQATGQRDWFLYGFAGLISVAFFGLVVALLFRAVPKDSSGVVFMLFGTLATSFGAVVGYFFGSSHGSVEKTKMLVDQQVKKE